jgi:hypothetical protein
VQHKISLMKRIIIVFVLLVHSAYAQVKVNEIRMKSGSEFHKAKDPDVIYPVISTGNREVDDKINFTVIKKVTGDDSTTDISKSLFLATNDGLSELDYKMTFSTKDIFSLRLDALGCGAYCSAYSVYLNFDLHTGELLKIEDVINSSDLDSFRAIVLKDKIRKLKLDKKQKDSLLSAGAIDSSDYDFMLERIQECSGQASTDRFSLFENAIQIVDPCELPHVMQAWQPVYKLRYSYTRIRKFINPLFFEKLKLFSY